MEFYVLSSPVEVVGCNIIHNPLTLLMEVFWLWGSFSLVYMEHFSMQRVEV